MDNRLLAHLLVSGAIGAVIGILIGLNLGSWGETYEYLFLLVPLILFFAAAMYVSFYGKGSMTSYSVMGFFTGYVFLVLLTVLFTQDLSWEI